MKAFRDCANKLAADAPKMSPEVKEMFMATVSELVPILPKPEPVNFNDNFGNMPHFLALNYPKNGSQGKTGKGWEA